MKRTLRLLAAPAAAMLLLASCGTSDETAPAEDTGAAEVSDAGGEEKSSAEIQAEYAEENGLPMDDGGDDSAYEPKWGDAGEAIAGTYDGALMTTTMHVDAPADIEAFREYTGQDPVGYIKVEIDNTNGIDTADVMSISLVDSQGKQYEYEGASDVYETWDGTMYDNGPENDPYWYSDSDGNKITDTEYGKLSGMSSDLNDTYWDTSALPTAKSTAWLAGPQIPESITYAEIMVPGMDTYPLTPTGN